MATVFDRLAAALQPVTMAAAKLVEPLGPLAAGLSAVAAASASVVDPLGAVTARLAGAAAAWSVAGAAASAAVGSAVTAAAGLGRAAAAVLAPGLTLARSALVAVLPTLDQLRTASGRTFQAIWDTAGPLLDRLRTLSGRTFQAVWDTAGPLLDRLRTFSGQTFQAIRDFAAPLVAAVSPALDRLRTLSGQTFQAVWDHAGPVFQKLVGVVGTAGAAVLKVGDAFAKTVGAASAVAGAVAGFLGQTAQAGAFLLSGPMRALDAGITAVNQNVTRFVQLANPGAVIRFQYAVDSLYATIGQALVPVLNVMTGAVRGVASAIAGTTDEGRRLIAAVAAGTVGLVAFGAAMTAIQAIATGGIGPIIGAVVGALGGVAVASGMLTPILDQMSGVLSGVLAAAGGALDAVAAQVASLLPALTGGMQYAASLVGYLSGAFQRLGPAIEAVVLVASEVGKALLPVQELITGVVVETVVALGQAFVAVTPAIVLATDAVGSFVRETVAVVRQLLAFVGINMPEWTKDVPQGKTGTPTAPVRSVSTTDVESVLRRARESAFALGGGGGEKPEVKTAANTSQMAAQVNAMRNELNGRIDAVYNWMVNAIPHLLGEVNPGKLYNYMLQVVRERFDQARQAVGAVTNAGVNTPVGRVTVGDAVAAANPLIPVIAGGLERIGQQDLPNIPKPW